MISLKGHITLLAITFASFSFGQNLEKLNGKDAIKVSGGVSFNTVSYFQSGLLSPRRDPFTWYASGNLNISILDVSLPFTYSFSNQGGNFTQPFNRTALHPKYKWATAHIGVFGMSFSPYTLSGHLNMGGGVELTPKKWKIKAVGGRLRKRVDYDLALNNVNDITYQRWGYGMSVAYEDKGYGGEFNFFKGWDDENSLLSLPLNSSVKPQDNLVMSLKGKAKIVKGLNVEAEYAFSALTQNVNDEIPMPNSGFIHQLVRGNTTTDFFNAFNSSLSYSNKIMKVSFKFEHVDPNYKTLGGYYFNNDLQNYTLAPSFNLFKKKLTVGFNSGFQRNNLSGDKAGTTNRWIGAANMTFVPTAKWVINTNYSNFSTFTRNRPIGDPFYYQPADTLNFYQLSQNASAMISHNFGEGDVKNVIQALYNYQESTSLSGSITSGGAFGLGVQSGLEGIPVQVHVGNLSYSLQFSKIEASLSVIGNINQTYITDQNTTFYGPSINFQKSLMDKKASLSLGSTYNRQLTNSVLSSNILNHRASFSWNPKFKNEKAGKVGLSLNANFMQRFAIDPTEVNINELNLFVNVNYSF